MAFYLYAFIHYITRIVSQLLYGNDNLLIHYNILIYFNSQTNDFIIDNDCMLF